MELDRIQKLAGLAIRELNEGIEKVSVESSNANEGQAQLGKVVHFDDSRAVVMLAELLGIPNTLEVVKIGKCFATYGKGNGLAFAEIKTDISNLD